MSRTSVRICRPISWWACETVAAGAAASRIDRLDRAAADAALSVPAGEEDAAFEPDALAEMYAVTGGYPYFIQAYGKEAWDLAPASPITADDIRVAVPRAESELAVGFFGSRYERATPAERDYLRAMAAVALVDADGDPVGAPKDSGEAEAYDPATTTELDAVLTSEIGRAHV